MDYVSLETLLKYSSDVGWLSYTRKINEHCILIQENWKIIFFRSKLKFQRFSSHNITYVTAGMILSLGHYCFDFNR